MATLTKYTTRWLKATEIYPLTLLEAVSLKLSCQQGHAPSGTLGRILPCLPLVASNPRVLKTLVFQLYHSHYCLCLHIAFSLYVYVCVSPLLLIKTPVILIGPTLMIEYLLDYICKDPISK